MAEAELARFIDRFTVEYVRVYAHPIERVWRAISDPGEFGVWFIPGTIELRVDGRYQFGINPSDFGGRVLKVDPPRLIRFGGSHHEDGFFQYELTEVSGGTRMRFIQHFPPEGIYTETPNDLGGDLPGGPGTPWKPGLVGGWHEFWDALADWLDGVPVGSRLPPTEFGAIARRGSRTRTRTTSRAEQADRYIRELRRQERWNDLNKVYRTHIQGHAAAARRRPRPRRGSWMVRGQPERARHRAIVGILRNAWLPRRSGAASRCAR